MTRKNVLLLLISLLSYLTAMSQTGYTEDFNASTISSGWFTGGSAYSLSQSKGVLNVNVNKDAGWASFGTSIPTIDVSANPFINLKVKTEQDVMLDLYLVDNADANINVGRRICRSDNFTNVSWDFTGVKSVDLTKISKIYVAVNGMALTYTGKLQFDDLKIGSDAKKLSNFSSIPNLTVYKGSSKNKILLQGLQNVQSIALTPNSQIINNVTYIPILSTGRMSVEFDAADVAGKETLTLTTVPVAGWESNSYTFDLTVSDNIAPTFVMPSLLKCKVGVQQTILLKDIYDGDKAMNQNINFSLTSDAPSIIGNNSQFNYVYGSTIGSLTFKPTAAGVANVVVTANDNQSSNNIATRPIQVIAYDEWNEAPTLDDINPVTVYNNSGEQTIQLTGITDGGDNTQKLVFSVEGSDGQISTIPVIEYTTGKTGLLKFTPQPGKIGVDTITVTLSDNGGNVKNNGDQSIVKRFIIDVQSPPISGYIMPFTDYIGDRAKGLWHVEVENTGQTISYEKDGVDDVLRINCIAKSTWNGLWYGFNKQKLDLSQNPYITLWVKSDNAIQFTLYFWDYKYQRNNIVNSDIRSIPANTWTKLTFDFYGKMVNELSQPISSDKIDSLLFNYHPVFSWPFTNFKGNVWIKDVRIGDKADGTFDHPKTCTIDDIQSITTYSNTSGGSINLSNITDGSKGAATVSISSSSPAVVPTPTVSSVVNGQATLSYTLGGTVGTSTVSVTVSAEGSASVVKTFVVNVLEANPTKTSSVTIDLNTKYQTMRGVGTFVNNLVKPYVSQYVDDLGASVARLGVIGNQLEAVNDNNDPYVLDMSALNYDAFDWDFYKSLKEKGVEHFILTVWSMPAWMKENASEDFFMASASYWDGNPNRVDTAMYEEYAENILATVKAFKEKAGIDLYAVSLQNEPSFCEPYASAVISPKMLVKVINMTGHRFEQEGIKCRIYMAEQVLKMPIYPWSEFLTAVQNDAEAWKYTDVQAVHGYTENGITGYSAGCSEWAGYKGSIQAAPHPKEFWMTETEPVTKTWESVLNNVVAMNIAFSCGDVSLWSQWGFVDHFTTDGKANQLTYAQSQFAKFVKPGSVRVSATTADANLVVTSFANGAKYNKTLATVVINKSTSPISIKLTGTNIPTSYDVYQTYYLQNFKKTAAGAQKDVAFLLPAQSITTFVSELPNAAPTIDPIPDQVIETNSNEQVVTLTGITDGGEGDQAISLVSTVSAGSTLITNVHVDYNSVDNTAKLYYTPLTGKSGNATIKVNVYDNGTINNKTTASCNIQIKSSTAIHTVKGNNLKVYPNPARDYVNVSLPDESYQTVYITNVMGEMVASEKVVGTNSKVNINNLKNGIYFISVKGESGTITKQLIKR